MKQFLEWLHNLGYSDEDIDRLPYNHIIILEDEYISLMEEYNG